MTSVFFSIALTSFNFTTRSLKNSKFKFNQMTQMFLLLLIIQFTSCQVIDNQRVEISPRIKQIHNPELEQYALTCSGVGQEPAFFTNLRWYDPKGNEIGPGNEFYDTNYMIKTKSGSVQLTFRKPTENLSGNYTCRGILQHVVDLSDWIQVSFYQDINFQDCPSTQALIKGDKNSLIRCKVSAKPPAELSWTKSGAELQSGKFRHQHDGLVVNGEVDESLEGRYDIEAHVAETGRIKTSSITVNVYTPPEIYELKPNYEVVEDEEAKLECKASGLPPPRYYWLDHERRNLSSMGGYLVDTDRGELIIKKVDRKDVHGQFTCVAWNAASHVQRSTQVDVMSKPRIVEFQNRTAIQYSIGTFTCTAIGNPKPTITLRKDGELNTITSGGLFNTEETQLSSTETRLTLTVRNVQRQDDGLYYCSATNKIGEANQIGHLQVEYKPDLSRTPRNVKTWGDRPVNLTCIVSSIPNATVTWFFKDRQLYSDSLYHIENEDAYKIIPTGINYLKITPRGQMSSIIGDYTCRAENTHGRDSAIINLSQAYRPSIRDDPDLSNDSPNSILIKFRNENHINDGGLSVKRMYVKYRERNETEDMARQETFPFDTDYTLRGLIPRKIYLLSFAVENDVGMSDWTREYEKIMPKESAPDCPKFTMLNQSQCGVNLRPVETEMPDRFDVKWLQPNDNGRQIEYYTMKVFPVVRTLQSWNRIGDYKDFTLSTSGQLVKHLTGLRANSTYEVEMRAKNSEGYSPPARLVFRTSHSNDIDTSSATEIVKTLTDFHMMIIIILISIVVVLIILDIILYVRYDFGFLFCICHGCSSGDRHRAVKKIKNSHSLNTGYSYHRPGAEIDPIMSNIMHKADFKAELEDKLIRLPKHSAV